MRAIEHPQEYPEHAKTSYHLMMHEEYVLRNKLENGSMGVRAFGYGDKQRSLRTIAESANTAACHFLAQRTFRRIVTRRP